MTARTELTMLRLRDRELMNLACARCGHRLAVHAMLDRPCRGDWDDPKACDCAGYEDPE